MLDAVIDEDAERRAPRGVRGLKYKQDQDREQVGLSRPARGAWSEINYSFGNTPSDESRPARGAWIEIPTFRKSRRKRLVAPREGCVD